ncbi:MAG: hypothetical protein P8P00_06125 [Polaribacter sp.]|nr:hypothetical protein [Polaribacter sp.]MDG1994471.1 hypothetical protein [Polaribacter sp.]
MKKILSIILLAVIFASCSSVKRIVVNNPILNEVSFKQSNKYRFIDSIKPVIKSNRYTASNLSKTAKLIYGDEVVVNNIRIKRKTVSFLGIVISQKDLDVIFDVFKKL